MSSTYRLLTGLDSGGVRYEAGDLISTLSASVMAGLVAQGAAELVSSFPQPRIGFNGGVIEVASDGSINLTPAAGKTVTIAGVEAGIAAGGAVADGVTDNTTAINNALLDAQSRGYKAVFLPPAGNGGLYLCTGLLTIPDYMTLYGLSQEATPQDIPSAVGQVGSILGTTHGAGSASGTAFITVGHNAGLRGLAIWHPNQTNTNPPVLYPYAIAGVSGAGKAGATIERVALINSYQGINLVNHGRWRLNRLNLNCALAGINIDQDYDFSFADAIEFYPFWTSSVSDGWGLYQGANLIAIQAARADGLDLGRIGIFNADISLKLTSSGSGSSYGRIGSLMSDTVSTGVYMDAVADTGWDIGTLQHIGGGSTAAHLYGIRAMGGVKGAAAGGGLRVHGGMVRGVNNIAHVYIDSAVGNARFLFACAILGSGSNADPPTVATIQDNSIAACVVVDDSCIWPEPNGYHVDLSGITAGAQPGLSFGGLTRGTPRINNPNAIAIARNALASGLNA